MFRLEFSHGAPFTIIGHDGGLLRAPATCRRSSSGWANASTWETVDVLSRFDRHRSLYVMRCHQLEHERMA